MQKNLIHPKHYVLLFYEYHQKLNLTQLNLTQLDPFLPKPVPIRTKYFRVKTRSSPKLIRVQPYFIGLGWPNFTRTWPWFYPNLSQQEPNPVPTWTKPDPIRFLYLINVIMNLTWPNNLDLTQLDPIWPGFTSTCPNSNRILSRLKPNLTQ